jgi:uncharacterized caspase-like protein
MRGREHWGSCNFSLFVEVIAKWLEDVLNRLYRFDKIVTIYNEQATRDHILDIFTEELPKQMGEDDALFVFWAGHGNQEKTPEGKLGYLIPYDGNPDKIRTNITMSEIKDTISKKIKAKHVFYVMDACYSGLLTATRAVDSKPQRDLAYLKEITKERVRQVLTAGSEGQEVLDRGRMAIFVSLLRVPAAMFSQFVICDKPLEKSNDVLTPTAEIGKKIQISMLSAVLPLLSSSFE